MNEPSRNKLIVGCSSVHIWFEKHYMLVLCLLSFEPVKLNSLECFVFFRQAIGEYKYKPNPITISLTQLLTPLAVETIQKIPQLQKKLSPNNKSHGRNNPNKNKWDNSRLYTVNPIPGVNLQIKRVLRP